MSVLTHLTDAAIRDDVESVYGEILSPPTLLRTDGADLTYACDVKIDMPEAAPATSAEQVLHSVPIAAANRDMIYAAEVGNAVTLARNGATGRFEIVGFSKVKPGTLTRIAVDLDAGTADAANDTTTTVRRLTFGELATLGGGFGSAPLGAYGTFQGGTLVEVRV